MKDFKGTPGNWFYQENSDVYTHIVRPADRPGVIITHLAQDSSGVTEADARLIAAAPELLMAAELAILELQLIPCKCDHKVIEVLESVIKKAYGTGMNKTKIF